jgi:Myb-like DNA-binding domain
MTNLVLDGVDGDEEQQLAALMDNGDLRPSDDDDDDDADNEAEAALDSILETSVAEVNLALSHDDAVTAAVNAAALDATTNADVTSVIDEVAVTAAAAAADAVSMQPIDGHETVPTTEAETLPMNTSVEGINSGTIDMLTPEERQEYLVKNLNMNIVAAAGSSNNNGDPPRVGRWTLDEKILFLYGLQEFGKGHWKKISAYVPGR